MTVEFNHTIVWSSNSTASAAFLADILGLVEPKRWGPFQVVVTANGVNMDFLNKEGKIAPQHYAFLVSEGEFDQIFGRVKERGLTYWADPENTQEGEINNRDADQARTFAADFLKSSKPHLVIDWRARVLF